MLIRDIYSISFLQGEGAPTLRKGTCANHIRDISKVLTGAHLTLNARTEDDIETDRILEKLNSIRFAVKENKPRIEEGSLIWAFTWKIPFLFVKFCYFYFRYFQFQTFIPIFIQVMA